MNLRFMKYDTLLNYLELCVYANFRITVKGSSCRGNCQLRLWTLFCYNVLEQIAIYKTAINTQISVTLVLI